MSIYIYYISICVYVYRYGIYLNVYMYIHTLYFYMRISIYIYYMSICDMLYIYYISVCVHVYTYTIYMCICICNEEADPYGHGPALAPVQVKEEPCTPQTRAAWKRRLSDALPSADGGLFVIDLD